MTSGMSAITAPLPPPPSVGYAAQAVNASKVYGHGETAVHALERRVDPLRHRRLHRDHGPVGFGQVHADALPGRPRHASRRARSSSATSTSVDPEREGAHAAAPRPASASSSRPTTSCPTLNALENITLPMSLAGTKPDRGVARHRRRPPSASATGSSTGRRSCRAASSSASRSPARWPAGPRSSSPTSRPATSTRAPAPRSSTSCASAVDELGQTIVMVTHDPVAAGVRRPRRVPRRRPDRRRDGRPDRRARARPHEATRATEHHVEGHPQGHLGQEAALHLDGASAIVLGVGVHGRHVRAHRHDRQDVRRSLRERLQGHRRGRASP